MILLTEDLCDMLLADGRQRDADHVPVVKFFNPVAAATWLATKLDADGDTMLGLANPGSRCPERGGASAVDPCRGDAAGRYHRPERLLRPWLRNALPEPPSTPRAPHRRL